MPVLRLLRSTPPDPPDSPPPAAVPLEPMGLEGFASESAPPVREAAAPVPIRSGYSGWLVAIVALVAVIEAVPTGLWARDYLAARATLEPAPPAAPVAPAPAAGGSLATLGPPCEVGAPSADAATAPTTLVAGALPGDAATPQPIAAGILSVIAPVPMDVYSRGRLIGTTAAESLMLPLGGHELDLVSDAVGLKLRRSVTVVAGRRTTLRVQAPSGTLNVNALPWAEVWIDDRRLGETPIGNLEVPVGSHELVFRHPEFGERRARVLVTLKEPARVSVDLRKP